MLLAERVEHDPMSYVHSATVQPRLDPLSCAYRPTMMTRAIVSVASYLMFGDLMPISEVSDHRCEANPLHAKLILVIIMQEL